MFYWDTDVGRFTDVSSSIYGAINCYGLTMVYHTVKLSDDEHLSILEAGLFLWIEHVGYLNEQLPIRVRDLAL